MQKARRKPGRPIGSTSEATRANILRAARACFAAKGFGEATNRDIAESARVTAAAIYQYFDSKVALYVAAAEQAMAEVAEHMRATDGETALGDLSAIVLRLLALHEHDPSLAAFLSVLPGELHRHPELGQRFLPDQTDVAEIITATIERSTVLGEIEPKDALRVGEMFIACMLGLSQYATLRGRGRPAATAFAELLAGKLFRRPLALAPDAPALRTTQHRTPAKPLQAKGRRSAQARPTKPA